jgi:hypothetical protein
MKDRLTSVDIQGQLLSTALFLSPHIPLALAPSAVLPEQFFSPPYHHNKGQAALMYAVLEDAFNCLLKQFVDNGSHARRLAQEAEEWFFSTDESWPFSFINVCLVLRINPAYVRKGLLQWRQQRPARIRRLRGQRGLRAPSLSIVP